MKLVMIIADFFESNAILIYFLANSTIFVYTSYILQTSNVHVVHTGKGKPYLRTNPNGKEKDNIDYLASER